MGLTTRVAAGWGRSILVVLVALALAGPSLAGETDDKRRALDLFERSEQHYRAGEMEQAQALLNEAYALDPNPVLQYNLGRVYEALGKLEQAAEAYRLFLEGTPDAPDRGAIERRIQTLEKQIAEREALQRRQRETRPPPQPLPMHAPSAPPPADGPATTPWIVSGLGAALVLGAGVTGLLARRAHDDAVENPSFQGAKDAQDRAEMLATLANVGFAVGGAALVVGVGWIALDPAAQDEHAAGAPPATVTLRGVF